MAKKVTVTLVDDFDGSGAADETVEFGLDGVTYEIDLSTKNATKLRGDLKQWVAAGRRVGGRRRGRIVPVEKPKPAVSVRKSVQDDQITCLECGGTFKSLKRHLMTHHNLSPEEYREKWDLPADYPMVAPAYAEARSRLAKEMGLGQRRKRRGKDYKDHDGDYKDHDIDYKDDDDK